MNTIRELKQEEKYNNMLKRKNKEISILKDDKEHLGEFLKESNEEIERLNNIINEINSIVEYWGYDKEHNDISCFRMAMKNIKDVLGSDIE